MKTIPRHLYFKYSKTTEEITPLIKYKDYKYSFNFLYNYFKHIHRVKNN